VLRKKFVEEDTK